jgi:hypothetical protein
MARYAVINDGVVKSHALADDADFAAAQGWIPAGGSNIGDLWDGENFTPAPPAPPVVPGFVTMRQARLALLGAGLLDDVDAAINAMPSPQKEATRIAWEYSQVVERHNGVVVALGPLLGLTDAQIDDLFLTAAQL